MSDYCIYLKAEPYLVCFLTTAYGNPVVLERDSPEARIIREYISKTPADVTPDVNADFNLAIRIPFFKEADPRVYNYLGKAAKAALLESFDQLVEKCMMREIGALENIRRGKIAPTIYAFMEKHGIPDDDKNWYTISQKYYRLRKKYLINGIKV
ncbi:MAG: hypothetical protein LBQ39_07000 [Tannerellaceae bacterium]|nr:hypothetical protein [Tannerellaceae bacterium]